MAETERKQVYRRLVDEIWNAGDLDAIDTVFAPDYRGYDPAPPSMFEGPSAFKAFVATMRAAFPDWHVQTDDMIEEGDKLVTRWTIHATHQGAFAGVAPTKRSIKMHGMSIHRIVKGQIVENWHVADKLSLLHQIGAITLP